MMKKQNTNSNQGTLQLNIPLYEDNKGQYVKESDMPKELFNAIKQIFPQGGNLNMETRTNEVMQQQKSLVKFEYGFLDFPSINYMDVQKEMKPVIFDSTIGVSDGTLVDHTSVAALALAEMKSRQDINAQNNVVLPHGASFSMARCREDFMLSVLVSALKETMIAAIMFRYRTKLDQQCSFKTAAEIPVDDTIANMEDNLSDTNKIIEIAMEALNNATNFYQAIFASEFRNEKEKEDVTVVYYNYISDYIGKVAASVYSKLIEYVRTKHDLMVVDCIMNVFYGLAINEVRTKVTNVFLNIVMDGYKYKKRKPSYLDDEEYDY